MKNKKTKLIRLLTIGGAVMAMGAVPIVMTACAKKTNSNNDSVSTFVPQLNTSNIKVHGDLKELVDGNVDEILSNLVSKNNVLKTIVTNADEYNGGDLTNITANVEVKKSENGENNWGTQEYSSWKSGTTPIYYSINLDNITVKNKNELYTKLTENNQLNKIFEASGVSVSNKTLSIVTDTDVSLEGDLLHVNVEVKEDAKSTMKYDLRIPASDINYTPDIKSVTFEGENVKTTVVEGSKAKITFDAGIDSTVSNQLLNTIDFKSEVNSDDQITTQKILDKLNFTITQSHSEKIVKSSAQKTLLTNNSLDIQDAVTENLNSEKIGEALGVFNTEFKSVSITKAHETYDGQYKLTAIGSPKDGHTWIDGTTEEKSFEFNGIRTTYQGSTWNNVTAVSKGISEFDIGKKADKSSFDAYFANKTNQDNFAKMIYEMLYLADNNSGMKNVHVVYLSSTWTSETNSVVRVGFRTNEGYSWVSGKEDNKSEFNVRINSFKAY